MATVYKLTNEDDESFKGSPQLSWGIGVTHTPDLTTSTDEPLCTASWIHVYESAELVHFLNPAHLNVATYHIWSSTGTIVKSKSGVIHGVRSLTTNFEVLLVFPTSLQRQKFAVLTYQGNLRAPASALFSPTAWLASTQDPLDTARFINALYQPMLDAARRSVSLARTAAQASINAGRIVNDATAQNEGMYALRAVTRAESALAGSPNWDGAMSACGEAIQRATSSAAAAAAAVGSQEAAYPSIADAKKAATKAAEDISPAIGTVIAIYAAKCTLATDDDTIALLSARTAVLAGAQAEAMNTSAGLAAFATAAMA